MTTTTQSTITDEQIEQLRTEAAEAGDLAQVVLCELALGLLSSLDSLSVSRIEARAECARVIADAAAQS